MKQEYLLILIICLICIRSILFKIQPKFRIVEYKDNKFWIEIRSFWTGYTKNIDTDFPEGKILRYHSSRYNKPFFTLQDASKRLEQYFQYINKNRASKTVHNVYYPSAVLHNKDVLLRKAGELFMKGKDAEGYRVLDKIKNL